MKTTPINLMNKDDIKAARWLLLAASDDMQRPVLMGLKVDQDTTAAANGFVLHTGPTPNAFKDHADRIIRPVSDVTNPGCKTRKLPLTPQSVDYELIDGTYPDYDQIIPQQAPTFRIALYQELLGNLATMPSDNGFIVLDMFTATIPMLVHSVKDGSSYKAIIMPGNLDSITEDMSLKSVKETPIVSDLERKIARQQQRITELEQELKDAHEELANHEDKPTPDTAPRETDTDDTRTQQAIQCDVFTGPNWGAEFWRDAVGSWVLLKIDEQEPIKSEQLPDYDACLAWLQSHTPNDDTPPPSIDDLLAAEGLTVTELEPEQEQVTPDKIKAVSFHIHGSESGMPNKTVETWEACHAYCKTILQHIRLNGQYCAKTKVTVTYADETEYTADLEITDDPTASDSDLGTHMLQYLTYYTTGEGRGWGLSDEKVTELENLLANYEIIPIDSLDDPEPPPPPAPAPTVDPKLSARLLTMADKMTDKLERDSQPPARQNTPRQRQQYRSRMHDVNQQVRVQQSLYALADGYANGTLPPELDGIKTKKALLPLVHTNWNSSGGYYDGFDTGKYSDDSPTGLALQALIQEYQDPDADNKRALALLEMKAKGLIGQVPGYFPTPQDVITTMLHLAGIKEQDSVLEPSAGDGAIADAIRERYPDTQLECIEINHTLADILEKKGHAVTNTDFLDYITHDFTKIIMNPPFENKQDIDHVLHAYEWLIDGGRLVSVMSASVMFRSDKKSMAFRDFVADYGYLQELPAESFKESGTKVNAVLCILDK